LRKTEIASHTVLRSVQGKTLDMTKAEQLQILARKERFSQYDNHHGFPAGFSGSDRAEHSASARRLQENEAQSDSHFGSDCHFAAQILHMSQYTQG